MRRLVYSVAASLDGFIAGPNREYDWMTHDPDFDFLALYSEFDTGLMGRGTYEVARTRSDLLASMKMKIVVVSTTLNPAGHPGVTILSHDIPVAVAALKGQPGKDIWLFGGGVLFRSLLDFGLVDAIYVSVMPVLLGSGVPLLPAGQRCKLQLDEHRVYPASGVVSLRYSIDAPPSIAP